MKFETNGEVNNPDVPLGSIPKEDGSHKIFSTRTVEKIDESALSFKKANPESVVFLRSNLKNHSDGSSPLALYERDEQHITNGNPDGEIFIAGSQIVQAALTPKVSQALERGDVIEVSQSEYETETETRERERVESVRASVESRKDDARKKYVAAFNSEAGFEQAWESIVQAETLAGLMR